MATMTLDDASVLCARGGGGRSRGGSPHGRIALQFGGEHSSHVKKGGGDGDSPRQSSPSVTNDTPLRAVIAALTTTPPQTPISSLPAKDGEFDGTDSMQQSTKKDDDDELVLPNEDKEGSVVLVVTSVLQALVDRCIDVYGSDDGEARGKDMHAEENVTVTTVVERVPLVDREGERERLQAEQSRENELISLIDHPSDDLPQRTELQVKDDSTKAEMDDNDDSESTRVRPPLTAVTDLLLWRGSRSRSGSVNNEIDEGYQWEGEGGMKGGIAMLMHNNRNHRNKDNVDEPPMSRIQTHLAPSTPPPTVRSSPFNSLTPSPSALALALSPVSIR